MKILLNVFRRKTTLLYLNMFVLFVNYMLWRLHVHLEPSLIEVELHGDHHNIYEHVRHQPHYHGNKDGVRRWSRSRLKLKENQSSSFLKKVRKKIRLKTRPRLPLIEKTEAGDCMKLVDGDREEMQRVKIFMEEHPKVPILEEVYVEWTKNCSKFKTDRGYFQVPLSDVEEQFPLAFSISTHTDIEQTERLIRSIYQPQNLYCIHVETKSSLLFHKAIKSIAKCFENVWITGELREMKSDDTNDFMPEIGCMRELLRSYRGEYKYFINLTGQEFPLRTNAELVYIAKIFNGSNDITGSVSRMELDRVNYIWNHRWNKTYQQMISYNTGKLKEPYRLSNVTFFKGETHGFFSAAMTEYLVENLHGRKFYEWCKDTGHAFEHYWNTLNYNPQLNAPGGYIGDLQLADEYSIHPVIRAKNWVNQYEDQWPCHGIVVRGICIFGVEDIAWLSKRPEMFINKFNLTYEYLLYDCLEELHRNKTMSLQLSFDHNYYKSLPTVKFSRKNE